MKNLYYFTVIALNLSSFAFAMQKKTPSLPAIDEPHFSYENHSNDFSYRFMNHLFLGNVTNSCLDCLIITRYMHTLAPEESLLPSAQKVISLVMEGKKTYSAYTNSATKPKSD